MAQHLLDLLRDFLVHYGYLAVAAILALENAGLPLPGETILLLASFLAYSEHLLRLPVLILVGIIAATMGDNAGFLIGQRGGRRFLDEYQHIFRIKSRTLRRAESIFQRYGAATIFFARFVFGLRVIAGPLAGVLRMPWKKFAIFNFLGATLWVSVMCAVGYLFGRHWQMLMAFFRRIDILIAVLACILVLYLWRKYRAETEPDD
jgi:membrane protein DedA with SNARE-associated domain